MTDVLVWTHDDQRPGIPVDAAQVEEVLAMPAVKTFS